MLRIRRAQWLALARPADDRLAEQLAAIAARHWAEAAALPAPARLERVRAAVDRARALGIDDDRDVGRFVMIDLALGAGFEVERTWARAILADERLPMGDRVARLKARAHGELG
ncbi:hypothetical protein WME95_06670 [Sorangium sp. So ce327]|uniref:hypothetical protein n=1 Tax=Sorangium sp. So ce327 TaxID=3133301 RepID=UPI003F5F7E70